MFSQILSVIIVLLIITFAPTTNQNAWIENPSIAFTAGLGLYGLVIGLIIFQSSLFKNIIRRHKNLFEGLVTIELILMLVFYHFFLVGQRAFPNSTGLIALFSLTLYFGGFFAFHYATFKLHPTHPLSSLSTSSDSTTSPTRYAFQRITFFFPFTLPFLIFTFFIDFTTYLTTDLVATPSTQSYEASIIIATSLLFLISVLLFFPPIIQFIWQCQPLRNKEQLAELESFCQKVHFRHAGIKTWTIMDHACTAAIVGILPKFRYILFTQKLLDELPPDTAKAVLAHEIGHNYHKHLLIYPTIIFGMMVCAGIFSLFFLETINTTFLLNPSWIPYYPVIILTLYCLIIALYFRFVFGYFSRLFERQADLYIYKINKVDKVNLPPIAMEHALDHLGIITGNTHNQPSWHHYSIAERISFLQAAEKNHSLIDQHHRRVKISLICYYLVLGVGILLLISPIISETSDIVPFNYFNNFIEKTSHHINLWINQNKGRHYQ